MIGATAYDLAKNWDALNGEDALVLLVGLVAAFVAALVVVLPILCFFSDILGLLGGMLVGAPLQGGHELWLSLQ